MQLLPPKPGTCPVCATPHRDDEPHNAQSLYYLYRFYGLRGRWPDWRDAMAHCSPETQKLWREQLALRGAWKKEWDEEQHEPIADPPAESFSQLIGDPNSRTFGPEKP